MFVAEGPQVSVEGSLLNKSIDVICVWWLCGKKRFPFFIGWEMHSIEQGW